MLRMYAQRFLVEVIVAGQRRPCPLDWLDAFCMRNFTGSAEFDDTLPLADGLLEAGFRVAPARLASALERMAHQTRQRRRPARCRSKSGPPPGNALGAWVRPRATDEVR